MIQEDTVKLLRECDAGIKMGVATIDEALPSVQSRALKKHLTDCKAEHEKLDRDLRRALDRFHDEGKSPGPMAKGMALFKTNMQLAMDTSDATVASLMTDGCNMGVKTLNQYLNEYKAADEESKDIAKRLIHIEERLTAQMRDYL